MKLAIDGGTPVRDKPYSTSRGLGAFGDEEIDAAVEVLRSRSLFRYYGPNLLHRTAALEDALRAHAGTRHALAVTSGTAALHCGLVGLGVEEGDEVIVPAVTFIATVSSVVWARAVPVFAEVDESLNMDPASFEANITDRTTAVIPVHLANAAADMDAINSIARGRGVKVLEDAAQAVGVSYKGRAVGSIGDAGAYSFQLEKNLTSGEGGALLTDDWTVHDRAARFSDQGGQFTTSKGEMRGETSISPASSALRAPETSGEPFLGANYRMTEISGAIAEVQLRKLPEQIRACREHARAIRSALPELRWRTLPDEDGEGGSLFFFASSASSAAGVARALRAEGIPAGQIYGGRPVYLNPAVMAKRAPWERGCPFNCELHPTMREYGPGLCPQTEDLLGRSVLIGVGPRMSEQDRQDVVTAIHKVCGHLLTA